MGTVVDEVTPFEEEIIDRIILEIDPIELRSVEIWTDFDTGKIIVTVLYQPIEGIAIERRKYVYEEDKLCPIDS